MIDPIERRALDAQLPVIIPMVSTVRVHLLRHIDDFHFRAVCGQRVYYANTGTIRRADFARLCKNCRRVMPIAVERHEVAAHNEDSPT